MAKSTSAKIQIENVDNPEKRTPQTPPNTAP